MRKAKYKRLIEARTKEVVELAKEKYGIEYDQIKIGWFNVGRNGGLQFYDDYPKAKVLNVWYNEILARENLEGYLSVIVPHEVAHACLDYTNGKHKYHCKEWREICIALGGTGETYHDFDMSHCQVRYETKWILHCLDCGRINIVSQRLKNQILSCGCLSKNFREINIGKIAYSQANKKLDEYIKENLSETVS